MIPDCEPVPIVAAAAFGSDPGSTCVALDLDLAGRGFVQIPDLGISRGFVLQRSRAEVGLRAADVGARVAFLFARSSGESGYVGIAGESIVPILEIGEARWDWRDTGLAVAAGLVDDVWVALVEDAWDHAETLPVLEVDQELMTRADLGGWASWTAPRGVLSVTASLTAGEGFQRRERNGGSDLTGVVRVRPLPEAAPVSLELAAFGRDGSRGIAQARDHRAGLAAILDHRWFAAGTHGVLGWGSDADGALLPAGASVWAAASDEAPIAALARFDAATGDRGTAETSETTILVAAGPRLPFRGEHRPASLTAGWEGRRWAPAAAPLAGADLLLGADLLFVQVSVRLRGAAPIEAR